VECDKEGIPNLFQSDRRAFLRGLGVSIALPAFESLYAAMNLKMMQSYENQLKEHKVWEPFLKMKNALHQQVYDDLKPLIRKKRMSAKLTAIDVEKLVELDKLIFDKLIK